MVDKRAELHPAPPPSNSSNDGTTTRAPAKAEKARNAAIKIAAPNFMRVFYHKSPPQK